MRVLLLSFCIALAGCSSTDIGEYADNRPEFVLEEFFQGSLTAHGVLKNRGGKVTRYFNATIDASWEDGVGTLAERFEFDDGEIEYRTWVLEPDGEGRYRATAGDVDGVGEARVEGNALRMDYRLEIDYRGREMTLSVEDWIWRVDDNTLINESTLRYWGFRVGTIQLTIVRKN